jgi:hypothetical protein
MPEGVAPAMPESPAAPRAGEAAPEPAAAAQAEPPTEPLAATPEPAPAPTPPADEAAQSSSKWRQVFSPPPGETDSQS